jgi:hypothetical protein
VAAINPEFLTYF